MHAIAVFHVSPCNYFVSLCRCTNVFHLHTACLPFDADQREDWLQRHGEVCLSEQHVRCALAACNVNVLIGYTDPNRPFQVNEETTLRRKLVDATSGSAAPVFRYFCSPTHCEEGKEDHEVTIKEYNCELARKEKELECKQEELGANTDHNKKQAADQEAKSTEVGGERERENHVLNSNDEGSATATTSAADAGSVKLPTEQPERLAATSSLNGMKAEQTTSAIAGASAGVVAAVTADVTATAGASGVKQGGVSSDPTHSNDATGLCSHPSCSQPGTKFCASCKTTGYCSAKCQTDDWPRHKESCEGRMHKMGKDYLLKVIRFCEARDWLQALRYCDLALSKLNLMTNPPTGDISVARGYKFKSLEALGRYEESQEYIEDASKVGVSPLYIAACCGHLTVVQKMLEEGADKDKTNDSGSSLLSIAARNGHLAVVQLLVEQGADKDKADNDGVTPLHSAALKGHLVVVQYFVEQGADKDKACKNGDTPLHSAAQNGHLAVVQYLVEQGADKDKADNDGASPLLLAAARGRSTVIQLLIELGADKDKVCLNGVTPLNFAALDGHLAAVQCLVEQGADKDKANENGYSPLHCAAEKGHSAVVQFLLQQGADMNKTMTNGRLPIDLAANEEIKQLIRDEQERRRRANQN